MKAFLKRWGLHHGIITLLAFPFVGWLIVALFIGKEFGEAIERARGTTDALIHLTNLFRSDRSIRPVWEPWDAITPIGVGLVFTIGGFLRII